MIDEAVFPFLLPAVAGQYRLIAALIPFKVVYRIPPRSGFPFRIPATWGVRSEGLYYRFFKPDGTRTRKVLYTHVCIAWGKCRLPLDPFVYYGRYPNLALRAAHAQDGAANPDFSPFTHGV